MDVSHAWVTACLRAYSEWQDVHAAGAMQAAAAGGQGSVVTMLDNRLGLPATLAMHFGSDVCVFIVLFSGLTVGVSQAFAAFQLMEWSGQFGGFC